MRHALAAAWVAFVILLPGVSPAHFWLDSGEIAAAGSELGVMHPPGGAGWIPWLRLVSTWPLGSIGFRMALGATFCAAATAGLLVHMLARRGAHPLVMWGTLAWLLSAVSFVRHGRAVEVYAASALLATATLWCWDPRVLAARRQGLRTAGIFVATLGIWLAGELRLLLVPVLGLLWCKDLWRGRAWARWAPLLAVCGSAVVLAMPIASVRNPVTDWGDPETFRRLLDHLNARSIRESYAEAMLPESWAMWRHNGWLAWRALLEDLGPFAPLAWVLSVFALARVERRLALLLAGIVLLDVFYIVGLNPMGILDRQTGTILVVGVVLTVGLGLHHATHALPRIRWAIVPVAYVLLVFPGALRSHEELETTRSWAPHAWSQAVFDQLPPGALLLTQSDDLAAGSLALRVLEGQRPDIVAVPAQHLYRPRPERIEPASLAARVWDAAARESTERGRIEAAIAAHSVAVALEHPRAGLFESVNWWSPRGFRPLGLIGPGVDPARPSAVEEIIAWLPRLASVEDRKRLAVAVAFAAEGRLRADGWQSLATAIDELHSTLQRVWPNHAGALVSLGALEARRGDRDRAVALTRRALELDPARLTALTNLALYLAHVPEDRDEALALARRAVALHPRAPKAWLALATVAARKGMMQEAAEAQSRVRDLGVVDSPPSADGAKD